MRDVHATSSVALLIGAATLAADNTPPSCPISSYDAVEIVLAIGIGGITFDGTNKIEFKLTHSDDDSVYTAVVIGDMLGLSSVGTGGIIKSLITAHASAAVYRFGYIGGKRFLKLLADFSGTHATGTPIAATAVRMRPAHAAQADQA